MKNTLIVLTAAISVVSSGAFLPVDAFAPSAISSSLRIENGGARIKTMTTATTKTTTTTNIVATKTSSTQRSALWRHWIPSGSDEGNEFSLIGGSSSNASGGGGSSSISSSRQQAQTVEENVRESNIELDAKNVFLGSLLSAALLVVYPATNAMAVSGGGLDFAGLDISGQDYSKNSYKGKDFTQVIAKATNFAGSNLQGCRFYKSYLVNADFTDADLTGASLEDTSMDGASLKNAIVKGTYFSKSLLDTGSVENADFTDAQFPPKVLPLLCDREDLKGSNPVTGADTRDSAMCP